MSLLARVLPGSVSVAEAYEDPADEVLAAGLVGEETAFVANAAPKRRREFAAARMCARRALAELGHRPVPIGRGERGMPLWPLGVVGTLTHTEGYRAAAVARAADIRSIGVDAEPDEPLPGGVLEAVALPEERAWIARCAAVDFAADRLLFCAKEATYKAWFPLTLRWLGFEDAHIAFTVDASGVAGTFASTIRIAPDVVDGGAPLATLDGRWTAARGLLVAAALVERR